MASLLQVDKMTEAMLHEDLCASSKTNDHKMM